MEGIPVKLLEVNCLDKKYYSSKHSGMIHAVNQVSFHLNAGEFLGLVGESGCGKSTIAKMITGLLAPDHGEILLEGIPLIPPFPKSVYRKLQMVFQLPQDSFDPIKTIGNSLMEIQRSFGVDKNDARDNTVRLLERVGLRKDFMQKYPHQLSGGECQRAAIARAIAVSPKIIICDEITSALDVSVQAQIVELLQDLREDLNLSLLFISHDLALVQGICNQILVMYAGAIVEEGSAEELLTNPQNQYTKTLFSSIFDIEPKKE
jgi:peptide/nickel transport system ATP-binding protein